MLKILELPDFGWGIYANILFDYLSKEQPQSIPEIKCAKIIYFEFSSGMHWKVLK